MFVHDVREKRRDASAVTPRGFPEQEYHDNRHFTK